MIKILHNLLSKHKTYTDAHYEVFNFYKENLWETLKSIKENAILK
jgi:hypothetical protein